MVINLPTSKWYIFLKTPLLGSNPRSRFIEAFKVYYLRMTLAQTIATTEEDNEKTIMQLWKYCDICDSINKDTGEVCP